MLRLLWRFGGRFLTVLALRLAFRLGLVPCVGMAWGLRRLVGGLDGRWPAVRPWWCLRGLALGCIAVPAALLWLHGRGYATPTFTFKWGWLVVGLYGALGLVLAIAWPGVPNVALFLWKGFGDGLGETTKLRNYAPGHQIEKLRAELRPVSSQRIATKNYGPTRFHTHAVSGPGLLTMVCGASGMGKSEWLYGLWRAEFDGVDFCGLATTKPRKILLLSEMGAQTLQPGLRRWGFLQEPTGRLDALRLGLWTPKGSAGGFIKVVHSADVYRPNDDGLTTDWTQVVIRARTVALQGGFDVVVVDTLGEWMGGDGNDAILQSLGACRQLTHDGLSVVVLHHTPRSDPRRPRGGGAIEAMLDTGWSIYGTGERWGKRTLHDPLRVLAPFKTRFQDVTPPEVIVEYLPGDQAAGVLPRYQLAGAPKRATVTEVTRSVGSVSNQAPLPGPGTTTRKLLDALKAHGGPATIKELGTDLDKKSTYAAIRDLLDARLIHEAGKAPTPGGGPASMRYVLASPFGVQGFRDAV